MEMDKEIKILMVDDETDFTEPMAFWFKSKGYTVVVASNGKDAIQLAKEENPDIMFMDLNMPGMNGIETIKCIRQFNKEIPVIVISAYADPKKLAELKPLRICGVFYKGEEFEKGLSLLESALRTHRKLKK